MKNRAPKATHFFYLTFQEEREQYSLSQPDVMAITKTIALLLNREAISFGMRPSGGNWLKPRAPSVFGFLVRYRQQQADSGWGKARDGKDAILFARAHKGRIHLLVADVVMPYLSGSQLAEQLSKERPETKVLYVSGYADSMLLRHGVTGLEPMFLQKPFTLKMLAWKIRQALTAPARRRSQLSPTS
ncbi:MAG TPA: response regulator [Terriglobales bacterium]|nr:response regulator [Terriglobales bacterium]